jgi:probable glycosyltransferase
LVDNASSDNSIIEIKRRYASSVKLIASDYNLGFGRANNLGVKHAFGQYLFLLNSDTILRNDPFVYFFEFFHTRENIGALGAYLKDGNGVYTKSGGNFYSMSKYLMIGMKRFFFVPSNEEIPLSNDSCEVEYVIGADLFIRKELFEEIGMFNKHIFMYFEDVEFCKRLHDAGYRSYLIPGPEIIHFVKSSSTSQFSRVYNTASLMYCIQKEHNYLNFLLFQVAYFLLKIPLLLNIRNIRKEWEYISSIFKYKQYLVK